MALFGIGVSGFFLFWLAVILLSSLKVVKQYERGVRFTLGKYTGLMNPGLRLVVPLIQTWDRVDLRIKTVDVPSQECVSKDNVSLKVNAVLITRFQKQTRLYLKLKHLVMLFLNLHRQQ